VDHPTIVDDPTSSLSAALDPDPTEWPVLVTGASGFVGGHVARTLARAGHRVRGLTRSNPLVEPDDPAIDWVRGDLRNPKDRRAALRGVRGVIHSASWVSLGADPRGEGASVNVEATRGLLLDSVASGVERMVYTSTLHTLAAGSADAPADEDTPWNLERVNSTYARTKREAEAMVLDGSGGRIETVALCPGMVIGSRDPKPTSTSLLIALARSPLAVLPSGGIPIIDARVAAQAHRRALVAGGAGRRYALAGPYLSFVELAMLVGKLTGRPRRTFPLPDVCERPMVWCAGWFDRLVGGRWIEVSSATVAGGFLRLHVRGDRADRAFGLVHPAPEESIEIALRDARRVGLARGVRLLKPTPAGRPAIEPVAANPIKAL